MTQATHTPGPWRYDGPNNAIVSDGQIDDICGDGDPADMFPRTVISTYGAMSGDDTEADVNLIAAAPDMLAALEKVEQDMIALIDTANDAGLADISTGAESLCYFVQSVIAKARGEG